MIDISKKLYAASALLPEGWAENVQISIDEQGTISDVESNMPTPATSAEIIPGVLLPGIANCHSHAFQRAMVGLAESQGGQGDDFWGWRQLMYRFLASMGPDELRAVATQLYVEMLQAGYTGVAEFHYLHHAPGGQHYDNPTEMSEAIMSAAEWAGIQLTLLPALYQYADFNRAEASRQQRFLHSSDDFQALLQQLATHNFAQVTQGMALHSLRAVDETGLQLAVSAINALHKSPPLHIHIAEQGKEVEACLAHTGQRPVDWLCNHINIDPQWCLVHATHLSAQECQRLAASEAVAGQWRIRDGRHPAQEQIKRDFFKVIDRLSAYA